MKISFEKKKKPSNGHVHLTLNIAFNSYHVFVYLERKNMRCDRRWIPYWDHNVYIHWYRLAVLGEKTDRPTGKTHSIRVDSGTHFENN